MESPTDAVFNTEDPFPILTLNPPNDADDPVPIYSETDTGALNTLLDTLPSLAACLSLPLTTYPPPLHPPWHATSRNAHRHAVTTSLSTTPPADCPTTPTTTLTDDEKLAIYTTQRQIITHLFAAIARGDTALVTTLIQRGLVSPDVPDAHRHGRTPLIAAIEASSPATVRTLAHLGAQVNAFGYVAVEGQQQQQQQQQQRTPLMVAAAQGKLTLVRLLVEELGADDGVVSPRDGQLALRLAAEAGHREVVAYLPARRGGAWLRWRAHHAVAVRRAKAAVRKVYWFWRVLLWEVPRFLVWTVPKHAVVKPGWKAAQWCWGNKHRFAGWCGRQVKEMPGRARRAGKAVWDGVKKAPKAVWDVVKEVPGVVKRVVKWLWRVIARIPAAMKKICVWLWQSLERVGKAVGDVFLRVVAVLHTALAAVLDFFRSITLKDVMNGVHHVLGALFVGLPRAVWKVVVSTGAVTAGILIGLFGLTGEVVVLLVEALWFVVEYVPRQLGEILGAIWSSVAKGYHELMVMIDPKH